MLIIQGCYFFLLKNIKQEINKQIFDSHLTSAFFRISKIKIKNEASEKKKK